MGKKIKVEEKQVNTAKVQDKDEALERLKEEDRAEERRLFQEAKAAFDAHLAADDRWTRKQHDAEEERSRAEELRETAKRLQGEASVLEAAAAAGTKRANALAEEAKALDTERAAVERAWSEAVERWEKLRYSLGLPFYDSEIGPPAWFTSPYEQRGLSRLFSEP